MKLIVALALSMPAIAAAFGSATCEPKDSQTLDAPNGQYCQSSIPQVEQMYITNGPDCWDACVADLGCGGFAGIDYNDQTGCYCQIECNCKAVWTAQIVPGTLYMATSDQMLADIENCP